MTLNERALIHGKAALASPDAEECLGLLWQGLPRNIFGGFLLKTFDVGWQSILDTNDVETPALDLAAVMYAQDVAEGRHT